MNEKYERTVKLAGELATHVAAGDEAEQLKHELVTFIEGWEPELPEGCTGYFMEGGGGIQHDGDTCPVHEADEMLERVIALDLEGLEREIEFAEAADDPSPEAARWLHLLTEELDERRLDERRMQIRLEAVANVSDAMAKLYAACDGDEAQVGEWMYEIDKAARRNQ